MTLTRSDFEEFFREATGHNPFAWQTRLLDHLLSNGVWPTHISAPTGAGKSCVIYIHTFAVALYAVGQAPRLPVRLALVVNRRGLVDSQEESARKLAELLDNPSSQVIKKVAEALTSLSTSKDGRPLLVTNMRGGLPSSNEWLSVPTQCAIFCATPLMFGSRLLFRGYGASRWARPREAGLFAFDTALVLDEAHLNRQLYATAKNVADLVSAAAQSLHIPALQVVSTTATQGVAADSEVGVNSDDLHDDVLCRRMCSPKPVTFFPVEEPNKTGRYKPAVLDAVTAEVVRLHQGVVDGRTVGCVVNTVQTAVDIAQRLKKNGLKVVCWVGRMRPLDLEQLKEEHPGLFTTQGDPSVDVLVATQTVEVGVDIDLGAMVMEHAPGSSLAQRAGRVNRLGLLDEGPLVVFGPERFAWASGRPYSAQDLEMSYEWLTKRGETEAGLAPWAITQDPAPGASLRRGPTLKLQPADVSLFARTSLPLFAEPDLELWLSDDLDNEPEPAGLVVRQLVESDIESKALVTAVPPHEREVFPAKLGLLQRAVQHIFDAGEATQPRAFLCRNGEVEICTVAPNLRPGDIVVVDAEHALFTEGVLAEPTKSSCVAKPACGAPGTRIVLPSSNDVSELGLWNDGADLLSDLAEYVAEGNLEVFERGLSGSFHITVSSFDEEQKLSWAVFSPRSEVDEEGWQSWTPSGSPVSLQAHSSAVANRARAIAQRATLAEEYHEVLFLAGQHHDDGKSDTRFQVSLDNHDKKVRLAKSGQRNLQTIRRSKARSGLPQGWRHEQLSVAMAYEKLADLPSNDRDLVLRLVGTSHGRGRCGFDHVAAELVRDPDQISLELFYHGGWEQLMERTQQRLGPWGCAYLEALLRAADGQVSGEGS